MTTETLRSALLEAASHLLEASNVIEDTGQRQGAVVQLRLAAEHAKRIAEAA